HPGDTAALTGLSTARALLAKVRARGGVLGSVPVAAYSSAIVTSSPGVVLGYEQLGEMLRLTGDVQGAIRAYSAAAAEVGLSADPSESSGHLGRLYGTLAELYSLAGNAAKTQEYRRAADRLK